MDNKRVRKQLLLAAKDISARKGRFSCTAVGCRTNQRMRDEYSQTIAQVPDSWNCWNWYDLPPRRQRFARTLAILFFREYINGQ